MEVLGGREGGRAGDVRRRVGVQACRRRAGVWGGAIVHAHVFARSLGTASE